MISGCLGQISVGSNTQLEKWFDKGAYGTVNIAGPREGKQPGIYDGATTLLEAYFDRVAKGLA